MFLTFSDTDLRDGVRLAPASLRSSVGVASGAPAGEMRVRAGAPLHVSWSTFYTGDIDNRKALRKARRGNHPVLLTSALKAATDAAPAARAFLAEWDDAEDRRELEPAATAAGASVLYYSAAVTRGLTITIDLFEKPRRSGVLSKISAGLRAAADFPPLALASGRATKSACRVGGWRVSLVPSGRL